jgi:hypothetical protein
MLALLKTEMKYFRLPLLVIIILPLIFTAFAISDIKTFPQVYFLKKYFWSVLVGLGIYGLVFLIWSMRKKEMRERKHALTPITVNRISFIRWLFGITPFVLVGLYIELLHGVLPLDQLIFIDRINGQLGMMFIALVAVDLVINSWIALESKRYDKRLIYSFLLIIALIALSIGVIYSVTTSLIKPFGFGGEEIFFFIWGLLLSVIDALIFTKRKSFLG